MILFGQRSSDQLCQTQYLGFIQQIIKTSALLKFFENLVKKKTMFAGMKLINKKL